MLVLRIPAARCCHALARHARARRVLALLLGSAVVVVATPAWAQYPSTATIQELPRANDPAELLAAALRTLAVEPANLPALIAAGENALALGDPNAAVGFLGRASEIAPQDGRVKSGLGSALVQLEKPQDALRLFGEASALGVPDADIAADRGLAYDLTGDPKRAQHDYEIVLAANPDDDDVRRRLALSEGISGDRKAAIATLDPLIRKRDIAGWRAQTFVLAMTGDTKGASDITHVMLPTQADKLQPFLARLAGLSAADKAKAVHFGEMPAAGRTYSTTELANTGAPATYASASRPAYSPSSAPARVASVQPSDLARGGGAPKPASSIEAQSTLAAKPARQRPVATDEDWRATFLYGQPAPRASAKLPSVTAAAAVPSSSSPAAETEDVGAIPMPGETPGGVGHFDLPHDAATRAGRSASRSRPVVKPPESEPTAVVPTPIAHAEPVPTLSTPVETKPEPAKPVEQKALEPKAIEPAPIATKPAVVASEPAPAAPNLVERAPVPVPTPVEVKAAEAAPALVEAVSKAVATTKVAPAKTSATNSADDRVEPEVVTKSRDAKADADHLASDDADATKAKGKSARSKVSDANVGSAKPDRDEGGTTAKSSHKKKGGDAPKDKDDDNSRKASASRSSSKKGENGTSDKSEKKSGKLSKSNGSDSSDEPEKSKKGAKADKPKAEPERVFVQVAGGANKGDMEKAWFGVKSKAPELMKGKAPSTTPLRYTNRLLVGPFKNEDDAQTFVNKMAGKGVSAFVFKSAKGQKVDKVDPDK